MRKKLFQFTFLLILCFPCSFLFCQPGNPYMAKWHQHIIDSLLPILKIAKDDSSKVEILHQISFRYSRLAEYADAVKYENESLLLSKKIKFNMGEKRAYSYLGSMYAEQGNYDEALKNHFAALKLQQEQGSVGGAGTSYNEIAGIYERQGKYNEALQYYSSAAKNWEQVKNIDGLFFLYEGVGSLYQKMGNYNDALKYCFKSLKFYEGSNGEFEKIMLASLYSSIGNIYLDKGDYSETLKYDSIALRLADEVKKGLAWINAYSALGSLSDVQGNYPEALKNYFKALDVAERTKNKDAIPEIRNSIGSIYLKQNNFPEALNNYLSALKLREELVDKASTLRIYANIGNLYLQQKNFVAALENELTALKISKETGDKEGIAISYNNTALIYFKQAEALIEKNEPANLIMQHLSLAQKDQESGLKTAEEIGERSEIVSGYIGLGNIFSKQALYINTSRANQKRKEAIQYLNKGLLLAKQTNIKEDLKDAYLILSETYYNNKEFKKALDFTKLYIALKDSLYNNETSKKMEQLRTQYEVDKAVAEEKDLQEKKSILEKIKHEKGLADQKTQQEKLIANEKARHEKIELEENFRHQTAMNDAKLRQVQLQAEEKIKGETLLAEERLREDKIESVEKSRHEKVLYEEKIRYQKATTQAKINQDKLIAQKEKRNNMIMTGTGFALLSSAFLMVLYRQKNIKKRGVEKANARHAMAELELQSLRTQLNPHFMFNSLNAIQELILMEDNERSHTYLSRFSKLVRILLENADQPLISLKKEIDFLQLYLSLENLRVPDMKYSIDTDGLSTEEILIPNMILQPYIENAIWHGLSHKQSEKQLTIRMFRQNGTVNYEIEDNGVGRKKSAELKSLFRQKHISKGMELLSKRFKLLNDEYGSEVNTTITDVIKNNEVAGTLVTVKVPVKLSDHLQK